MLAVNLMIGWQFDVFVVPTIAAVVGALAWPYVRRLGVDE